MIKYLVSVDKLGKDLMRGTEVLPSMLGGLDNMRRLIEQGSITVHDDTPNPEPEPDAHDPEDDEKVPPDGSGCDTWKVADLKAKATGLGIESLPSTKVGLITAIEMAEKAAKDAATEPEA